MMITIKVTSHLDNLSKMPKKLEKGYSEATKHIAEVCQRAAQRNLRQVNDTGNLRDSIEVFPVGKFNHEVRVGMPYGSEFEVGVDRLKTFTPELYDWATRRASIGYRSELLPETLVNRYLAGKKYVMLAQYSQSPAIKFMSRAVSYTKKFSKGIAENEIEKVIK